jgi:hypothetical protein
VGAKLEYREARSPGRVQRSEPSWPTVIATTVRLWIERHPLALPRALQGKRAVLAVVAAGLLGAGTAGALIGHAATTQTAPGSVPSGSVQSRSVLSGAAGSEAASGAASSAALARSAATRHQAATWIAGQVTPSAIVACDPAMCAALQAAGVPAGRLLALGTSAADPLGSEVIAATPALRSQFGASLARVYAPGVIASFGSGASRIDIRAIAPDGAAAYNSALAADRRARIAAGGQLLHNPHVIASAGARAGLRTGAVDPRLLMTLAALAVDQPVRIVALSDPSPGAVPPVPLRGAVIAPLATGKGATASLRSMQSFLESQQPSFAPLWARLVRGQALSVQYAAPSPVGLLGGR